VSTFAKNGTIGDFQSFYVVKHRHFPLKAVSCRSMMRDYYMFATVCRGKDGNADRLAVII
jgi:hypothetical protein